MPNPADELLAFQCPKCMKRLKAGRGIAGKRVKCPKCGEAVTVPGISIAPPAKPEEDWLSLETPAIEDISDRQESAADVKAKRDAFRAKQHRVSVSAGDPLDKRATTAGTASATGPATSAGKHAAAGSSNGSGKQLNSPQPAAQPTRRPTPADLPPPPSRKRELVEAAASNNDAPQPKRSVFDEDLPELSQLEPAVRKKPLFTAANGEHVHDLDSLIPDVDDGDSPPTKPLGPLLGEPDQADHEYRITCKVCGTGQYVRLSAKGMKIKCPDCFSEFRVPGPPAGWSPKGKKKLELSQEDMPLAETEQLQQAEVLEKQRSRTSAMLEKAEREISDEDFDRLYAGDFDTAGFMRRTFGFLTDPIAVSLVLGYAIVFALVFALAQYGLNNRDNGFGRGALLLGMIGGPLIGILFGLPMLSSGLALLESVANRQSRVADWPGFDMFDNFGDLVAIAGALLAACLPGFLIGYWLGGDGAGAGRIQLTGMMLSTFALFPIFLLSILDNGSLFQPISHSVMSSLGSAAEAWGGYFLKTAIAFSVTVLLWFLLLGQDKPPLLAGIAGALLPPLVFFTFQQIGALADSISEHLSFEFTPPERDQEDGEAEDIDVKTDKR